MYQLDEECLQWIRMDERSLSLAETRRRMDQVKLGGTRESITMLPIINCESTRCVIRVAKSTKAADDARRQLAAGTLLAPTVEAAEGISRASKDSVRVLSACTDSPVPPARQPLRSPGHLWTDVRFISQPKTMPWSLKSRLTIPTTVTTTTVTLTPAPLTTRLMMTTATERLPRPP